MKSKFIALLGLMGLALRVTAVHAHPHPIRLGRLGLRQGPAMSCGTVRMHGMAGFPRSGMPMNICMGNSTISHRLQRSFQSGADLMVGQTSYGAPVVEGVVPINLHNGQQIMVRGIVPLNEIQGMGRNCPPMQVILMLTAECQMGAQDSCGSIQRIRRGGCGAI